MGCCGKSSISKSNAGSYYGGTTSSISSRTSGSSSSSMGGNFHLVQSMKISATQMQQQIALANKVTENKIKHGK